MRKSPWKQTNMNLNPTLITSKNSEFKNEDYETFYGEIVKFCIVNEIEYELV